MKKVFSIENILKSPLLKKQAGYASIGDSDKPISQEEQITAYIALFVLLVALPLLGTFGFINVLESRMEVHKAAMQKCTAHPCDFQLKGESYTTEEMGFGFTRTDRKRAIVHDGKFYWAYRVK